MRLYLLPLILSLTSAQTQIPTQPPTSPTDGLQITPQLCQSMASIPNLPAGFLQACAALSAANPTPNNPITQIPTTPTPTTPPTSTTPTTTPSPQTPPTDSGFQGDGQDYTNGQVTDQPQYTAQDCEALAASGATAPECAQYGITAESVVAAQSQSQSPSNLPITEGIGTLKWMYIGIIMAAGLVLLCSLCIYVKIKKYKSKQEQRKREVIDFVQKSSEDRSRPILAPPKYENILSEPQKVPIGNRQPGYDLTSSRSGSPISQTGYSTTKFGTASSESSNASGFESRRERRRHEKFV